MKKFNLTLILLFLYNLLFAQTPLIKKWDKRFGGINDEVLTLLEPTIDGGCILGGYSRSGISGDKSESNWGTIGIGFDFWIVKVDSNGNKQWDKRFGGTSFDGLYAAKQVKDSGYIFGGFSSSNISGDKTQSNWDPTTITNDFWIVKTDSLGNKLWDKRYGGIGDEELISLQQTSDGGYILAGNSNSVLSGDKSQANWDTTTNALVATYDYWIVKTDSVGNFQWDKRFGGTNDEKLFSVQQTFDGGYILGGASKSGISGDKTESNWDSTLQTWDYWMVKVDALGIKQWDKRFGGNDYDMFGSLKQTFDHGYILGGISFSGISGNKSIQNCGTTDFWIIKIDSSGNKQTEMTYGSYLQEEDFNLISSTTQSGFLLGGTSYSPSNAFCLKAENNLGNEQSWIVKIDSNGVQLWDKTLLTTGHDEAGYAIQTTDDCYIMGGYTWAGIGGEKTQANWDTTNLTQDYWIIKFCDTTSTTSIQKISNATLIDINPNPFTSNVSITIQKQNTKQASFAIINILEQTVFNKQENNLSSTNAKTIDLSFLSKGIYLLEVILDGERTVKKIVKE